MWPGMIPIIAFPALITPAQVGGAAFPGRRTPHHVRAVGDHLLGVEGALVAREPLDDDRRLLIEQDAHDLSVSSSPARRAPCCGPRRPGPPRLPARRR